MDCPYCGKEMKRGIISGDGRKGVHWKEGDKKSNLLDNISGNGNLSAVKSSMFDFVIEAYYCNICRKMIFDTDIS